MEPFSHHSCVQKVSQRTATPIKPEGESDATCGGSATAHSVCSSKVSSTRHIHSPRDELPCPKGYPHHRTDDDTRQEASRATRSKPAATLALMQQAITIARNNLTEQHWFHPLSFQQVQALLTLFSKSFSSFPHGTCLLSVSNPYLA